MFSSMPENIRCLKSNNIVYYVNFEETFEETHQIQTTPFRRLVILYSNTLQPVVNANHCITLSFCL